MNTGALGKVYGPGEAIVHEGEVGDKVYVIQDGQVEVVLEREGGKRVQLAILDEGQFFGEMAVIEHEPRVATVRAVGFARVLTVDKDIFLRRIHEDPSLAYHIVQVMSGRIRERVGYCLGASLSERLN